MVNGLGNLAVRPGQHRHMDPRHVGLFCDDILYREITPRVHRGHVARIDVQHRGGFGMSAIELMEKTTDGRIRAGVAVGVLQQLVDDCTPDTVTPPERDFVLVVEDRRGRLAPRGSYHPSNTLHAPSHPVRLGNSQSALAL